MIIAGVLRPRVAFILLLLWLPLPLAAGQPFFVKAPPAWVQPVALAATAPSEGTTDGPESGAVNLLVDHQYRVTAGRVEHYIRRVNCVVSAAGLEDAAQLQLNFEPTYQQLIIHHIRILRGGRVIDALRPREISVIQKEEELNKQLYNGELTALALLSDVRVGDVIDYAYSVNGNNPVLGGRFTSIFYLGESQPVALLRHRLLWPAGQTLHFRADGVELQPAVRDLGGQTEYVWERRDVPPVEPEDRTPSWYNPHPQVMLSEFADWADVVRWAVPLYEAKAPAAGPLARQIAEWRAVASEEDAILRALRFVQDEVRYLGIELGPYSHQPTPPAEVFARRFGDCKDKSLLLAVVLRSLGVEAYPALVNTERGRALRRWQPSPFAFDHVIVQAFIGGKAYWFDPTISHQRGRLSQRYNPDYGLALVIRKGGAKLEEIAPPDPQAAAVPTTIIKEIYRAPNYAAPATLEVVTTYLGPDADEARAYLAGHTRQEVAKHFTGTYADGDASIESVGLPQVRDDEAENKLVVTEKYRIPRFWRGGERRIFATQIYQSLSRPRSISARRAPLALPFPLSITHSIEVELPEPVLARRDTGLVTTDAMNFEYRYAREGRTVRLEYSFRTLSNEVPLEGFAAHLDALDKIENQLSYGLTRGRPRLRANDAAMVLVGVLVLLAVLAVPALVIGLLIWTRRRKPVPPELQPAAVPTPAPGSLPAAAIELGSTEEIERYVSGLRCECGNLFHQPGAPLGQEGLIFDGRRLLNIALKCVRCGAQRDWYFVRPQPLEQPPLGDAEYSEA